MAGTTTSNEGLLRLGEAVKRYADYHTDTDALELMKKGGMYMAKRLYEETRAIAPSREKVLGAVTTHWRNLTRKKRGGRITSRASERARRLSAIGFMSLGWLAALQELGGYAPTVQMHVSGRTKGSVRVRRTGGKIIVELICRIDGYAIVDAKYGMTDRAIQKETDDIVKHTAEHYRKKLVEELNK
jgi:hypothetical protein